MDILVLSDSHGRRARLACVMEQINFRPAAILYLGDGLRDLDVLSEDARYADIPIYAVRGNCDGYIFGASNGEVPERALYLGNKKIVMMHGDRHGVRQGGEPAMFYAASLDADVLLYGHTHVPFEMTLGAGERLGTIVLQKPLLVANPGSIGEPREGLSASFGVLTIRGETVLFSHGYLE